MTKIFAHRGSRGTHPENTLPAFREAVRVGCDGIELDVHLTKDHQLVVIHDEKVDRTTNGEGYIKDLTLAEIKALDAGFWAGSTYSGTQVPTLTEVFLLLEELNFTGILNVEIKTDEFHYAGIEEKIIWLEQSKAWPFQVIYSSFHYPSLELLKDLHPTCEKNYLLESSAEKIQKALAEEFITGFHPSIYWLSSQAEAGVYQPASKPVRIWTVNEEAAMLRCFELGVTAIFTDYPQRALALWQDFRKEEEQIIDAKK